MKNTIEVILNNEYKLDVNDDLDLSIIYQLADIREFDKRKGDYVLPFIVPGSKNNNEIFGWIFVASSDTLYDPNKRADIVILSSGVKVFEGYVQLNKINVNNTGELISYELTAYSSVLDFVAIIKDKKMCDLELSKWNHEYTAENVQGSWETFIIENGAKYPFEKGRGYVYPYIDWATKYGVDDKSFEFKRLNTEFFIPTPYLRSVFTQIISDAGFTYKSEFIDSDLFSSLVITPNVQGLYLDNDELERIRAKAVTSATTSFSTYWDNFSEVPFYWPGYGRFEETGVNIPGNDQSYDVGNNFDYDPTLGDFYRSKDKFHANIRASISFLIGYGSWVIGVGPGSRCGNVTTNVHLGEQKVTAYLVVKKPTDIFWGTTIDSVTSTIAVNYTQTINCNPLRLLTINLSANDYQLEPDDMVYVYWFFEVKITSTNALGQQTNSEIKWQQVSGFLQIEPVSSTIEEGSPIDFNRLMSCDVNQLDLFSSVLRLFNLYTYVDREVNNRLIIETRKDFFNGNLSVDWNRKLDRSTNVELIPIPELNSAKFLLSYKEDNDYFNESYQDDTREVYGQLLVESNNEFNIEEEELEVIFSPTPLIEEFETGRIISAIYLNRDDKYSFYEGLNIRILYYGGMYDSNYPWALCSSGVTYSVQNKYPYAGHTDNPTGDIKLDLLFNYPIYYFYDRTQISTNNLYNLYWKDYITEIFDKNAKMLIGEFYLTEYDIQTLNLRNYVFLDGVYWYINKIDGFNPINKSTTTVELLRVINNYDEVNLNYVDAQIQALTPFSEIDFIGNRVGGSRSVRQSENVSKYVNNFVRGINNINPNGYNNVVIGDRLLTGSETDNSIIIGNDNRIGQFKNSIMIGNSNTLSGNIDSSIFLLSNYDGIATQSSIDAVNSIVWESNGIQKISLDQIKNSIDNFNQVRKITLTQSLIASASSFPVELVSSPGTSSAIDLVSFAVGYNYSGGGFLTQSATGSFNSNLIMGDQLLSSSFDIGFTQSGFQKVFVNPVSMINEGISFKIQDNDVIGGTDSSIDFYLTYNILGV